MRVRWLCVDVNLIETILQIDHDVLLFSKLASLLQCVALLKNNSFIYVLFGTLEIIQSSSYVVHKIKILRMVPRFIFRQVENFYFHQK